MADWTTKQAEAEYIRYRVERMIEKIADEKARETARKLVKEMAWAG